MSYGYWTTIAERLPPLAEECLVTTGDGKVRVARYRGEGRWLTVPGGWNVHVVAWQHPIQGYRPAEKLKPAPLPTRECAEWVE